jgi:tetratricopeptide (TPR) repeat protein
MDSVDDSDGCMSELLGRLQEIHLNACRQAKPEPVALAKKLFEWELHSDFDIFYGAVDKYAELLGPEGLRAYRRLAEKEWAKVPARTSNSRDAEWGKHFRITHIMETLAMLSGDVAEHIRVLSRDLSSAYSYLQIAEVCSNAGDHDQALQWAERGERAFPEHTDFRLREFLANEYHGSNRHDEAMNLIWQDFVERPGLESYRTLKTHAEKDESWPQWRERALAEIRCRVTPASQSKPAKLFWMQPEGHSLLVQIFLYEGDADAAWNEAQQGGCRDSLWLELAAVRGKDHPEDAVPIYLRQAEDAITRANNSVYDPAVALLVKAGILMSRMGKSKDFDSHVDSLRITYKRKRNFIKLLDRMAVRGRKETQAFSGKVRPIEIDHAAARQRVWLGQPPRCVTAQRGHQPVHTERNLLMSCSRASRRRSELPRSFAIPQLHGWSTPDRCTQHQSHPRF